MKKIKKGLAYLLAAVLAFTGIYTDSLRATAGTVATIDISFRNDGGIVQVDAGSGWTDIAANSTGVEAQKVRIVPNGGKEVDWTGFHLRQGEGEITNDATLQGALTSADGYSLTADTSYVMEGVEFRDAGGGGGAGGGGERSFTVTFTGSVSGKTVTYNVDGVDVTATVAEDITITDSVAVLRQNAEIAIGGTFDAETMQVKVAAPDGFNKTLAVSEGKVVLDGSCPDVFTFTIEKIAAGDPPAGPPAGPAAGEIQINVVNGQNGVVSYKIGEGSWNTIGGSSFTLRVGSGMELDDVTTGTKIYLKAVPNTDQALDDHDAMNNRVRYDDADHAIDLDALAGGTYYIEYNAEKNYSAQIQFEGAGDPPAGPPVPENPKDIAITVNYEDGFFTREGSLFTVDGYPVDTTNDKVTIEDTGANHVIAMQVWFGTAIDAMTINGVSVSPVLGADSTYTVEVADATAYDINITKGVSDDVTIVWTYDHDDAVAKYGNDDAWVENGSIELVSVTRGGVAQNLSDFNVRDDGGDLFLKRGDNIVLRLIPAYGYQLARVDINGETLVADDANVSTFAISDLQNNLHFKGVFVEAANEYKGTSALIDRPSINEGENAAQSGVLELTVADNSTYATDVTAAVAGEGVEKIGSVDFTLNNLVSKGTEGAYWSTPVTAFTDPIVVSMDIDFAALNDGETFSVVRDHKGTLTEIPVNVKPGEGRIEFETNQFSTYTIVKKVGEPGPVVNPGDFGFLWDSDFTVNDEDGSVSVNPEFVPCDRGGMMVGDLMTAFFYRVNDQLELMPDGLFKNDSELRDDISIKYSTDGSKWDDATFSVAMGIDMFGGWDEWCPLGDKVDLRMMQVGDAVFQIAFCREGFYKIVSGDGKQIEFEIFGRPVLLTHDSEADYYYGSYDFADNDTFTIKPGPDVVKYAVVIQARSGYGADGNKDNYFFTATSGATDVTNKLLYVNVEEPFEEAKAAPYTFGTETTVLHTADFASKAEVFVKYTILNPENGKEEEYIDSYYLKTSAGDRDDDAFKVHFNKKDEEAQSFQCFAVTKEEYDLYTVDYFLRRPLYISYGKTMAEAIDVMVAQMDKGTVPNLGYLLIRSKVALNNEEEVALSMEPQYVSTPDNVKGVILTCQEMDYVVKVKNGIASVNGGNDFEEWVSWTAPRDGSEEIKYLIQVVPKSDTYYELTGSYEDGDFSIKDGTPLKMTDINGMPVLMINGREYMSPMTCVTEYQLPEIHVDATTEIHLVGSFKENENDQPSIFLNLPEGSDLLSVINNVAYSCEDMGNIFTEQSTFHSWYSGDVECEYTVKIDKLETKTILAADEKAGVTAAETLVPIDALFAQLTGANSQLTAAEKSQVAAGKNITVTVDITAETDTTENMALAVADEYAGSAVQYMNIDLLYHVGFGDVADKNITETTENVAMLFTMSDDFYKEGTQYVILREHDGVVEELECAQEGNQIVFETNKFSSYAIVEKDHTHEYGSDFDQTCNLCGKERNGQCVLVQEKKELTDSVISTTLKDKGYDTVAKVEGAMSTKIAEAIASANASLAADKKIAVAGTVYMDVAVNKYSVDGGLTYVQGAPPVGAKFTILIPFPEGTNKTYQFIVAHMIGSGAKAGTVELPSIFVTDLGIEVTMENGLSPIAVSWTKAAPEPNGNNGGNSGNSSGNQTTTIKSPKTGDTNRILLWVMFMLVGAGVVAYGYMKKRQAR